MTNNITVTTLEALKKLVLGIPYDESAIFSVVFTKKNGELRKMICRRGVKKHLAGGELKYNAAEYKLLPVFDMSKGEYRMVNCESIGELVFAGKTYRTASFHKDVEAGYIEIPEPPKG